jgi:glutaredoxin/glutathione-dependent peroxiredoxin
MVKIGDKLPHFEFMNKTPDGLQKLTTEKVFGGQKVVLVGVPGAFTPTCTMNHLPAFVEHHDKFKAKGVDAIACVAVNDPHVMAVWEKHLDAGAKILMLADGNADFAKATGLDLDLNVAGMGVRNKRYSMLVEDGVVKQLNIETEKGVNVSGAETILAQL